MRLDSLIHELLQNVISHSSSRHAAIGARAVAPRGKTIEIGLADDGVGIAAHVVAQSSHSWLSWLSDASVTETTLANQLSGRDPHSGGGCLGEVMRAFLRQADADVTIRSGTAHVKFANARDFSVTKHNLTFGMGTQILIRIRP